MRRPPETGFSIIELVISLSILSLATGAALSLLDQSADTYVTTSLRGRIEEEGRKALSELSRVLKLADMDTLLITQQNGSDRVDLNLPAGMNGEEVTWSGPITYLVEPSTKDANLNGVIDEGMLVAIQNGRRWILCHYIPLGGLSIERTGTAVSVRLDLMIADKKTDQLLQTSVSTSVAIRN